ncbi:MAG: hypothetical protein V1899_05790 [Planctomycetota bacterium]
MNIQKQKIISREQINISSEADYIVKRAQNHDGCAVALNDIVFFSTENGDAWMLDPQDQLALCLARDGIRQDYVIVETASNFHIAWDAQYNIDGDMFVVVTRDGQMRSIFGYPTKEINKLLAVL